MFLNLSVSLQSIVGIAFEKCLQLALQSKLAQSQIQVDPADICTASFPEMIGNDILQTTFENPVIE